MTDRQQAAVILGKLGKKKLMDYLSEHVLRSRQQLLVFLAHFADQVEGAVPDYYKKMIKRFAKAAMDRHGFIDYYSARSFVTPVDALLQNAEDCFAGKSYQRGVWICMAIIEEIPVVILNMDDSNGGSGMAFNWAVNLIGEHADDLPQDLRQELFGRLQKEYSKTKYSDFGFDSNLLDLMVSLANNPEMEAACFKTLDKQIVYAKTKKRDWQIVALLRNKIDFLKKSGKSAQARKLIESNLEYAEFRRILVDEAIKAKAYSRANKLVNEGRALAQAASHFGNESMWDGYLLKIARSAKNKNDIRAHARALFYSTHYSMEYYRILRKTYDKTDWQAEVEKIVGEIHKESKKRWGNNWVVITGRIYADEKQPEKLLDLLQKNELAVDSIVEFLNPLREACPAKLLTLYKKAVMLFAKGTGRNVYRDMISHMKKMQEFTGGREVVTEMIAELREKYRNRPAMLEMLTSTFG